MQELTTPMWMQVKVSKLLKQIEDEKSNAYTSSNMEQINSDTCFSRGSGHWDHITRLTK